jgi:hypothetical protein
MLFRKCTTAVRLMAISTGKKMAKAGNSKVPNPKPEKNDNKEAIKATNPMIRYSIL